MKGKRSWKKSNLGCLAISMILGAVGIIIFAVQATDIVNSFHNEPLTILIVLMTLGGFVFLAAIHSFWGMMTEMADNVAAIVDIISQNENKVSKPISVRSVPTPQSRTQPQTTDKPFIVNIEYDDGMWGCGNCGQLNNPDCEFCTNCGKFKGKLKIQPPD